MSSPTTIDLQKLSENQRAALINLLADDNPEVYQAVRERILAVGKDSCEWLEPCLLSNDPVLRRRAREIVQHHGRQEADNEFLAFCLKHGREFDLEQGAWLLARTEYPEINVEAYRAILDSQASGLQQRIGSGAPAKEILAEINNYLFDDLNFAGNEGDYYDPDNSYLNRVMDRRTGNPISLCLVYMLLCRRLQLPVAGIGLPGHFICRYQSTVEEIYVDVFNRGRLLTKTDCVQYLLKGNYSLKDDFLGPVSARRILMRTCTNLHKIYLQRDPTERATRLQRYIVALAR